MGGAEGLPRLTRTELVTFVLCASVFSLGLLARGPAALALLILAIPFGSRNVAGSTASFLLPLTLAAALGSRLARPGISSVRRRLVGFEDCAQHTPRFRASFSGPDPLLFLFAACQVTSLLSYALRPFPTQITLLEPSPGISILQLLGAMTGGLLLYRMVQRHIAEPADGLRLAGFFVATILVLAVAVVAGDLLHLPLPDFFRPWVSYGLPDGTWTTLRGGLRSGMPFAGFHGFVENFGEYLVIVFALGYGLFKTPAVFTVQRPLGLVGMGLAVLFAIPSGCKAVPLLLALFWLAQIALGRGPERRRLATAGLAVLVALALNWRFLAQTPLGLRLGVLVDRGYGIWHGRLGAETLSMFLGREGLDRLWSDVLPVAGLFGVGPVIVHAFEGSIVPYHNLYYQVWLDYGAVGLVSLGLLLFTLLRRAVRLRKASNPTLVGMGDVLLALLPLLLLEQLKVSAFRLASGVYTGWYLFALLTSLERLGRAEITVPPEHPSFSPREAPRHPFCGQGNRLGTSI
jgi:hypothetical protein